MNLRIHDTQHKVDILRNAYILLFNRFVDKVIKDLDDRVKSIYVHGGFARGDFVPPKSDVDMDIILSCDVNKDEFKILMKLREIWLTTILKQFRPAFWHTPFVSFPDELQKVIEYYEYYEAMTSWKLIHGQDIIKTLPIDEKKAINNFVKNNFCQEILLNSSEIHWTPDGPMLFNMNASADAVKYALALLRGKYFPKRIDAINASREFFTSFTDYLSRLEKIISDKSLEGTDDVELFCQRFYLTKQIYDETGKRFGLDDCLSDMFRGSEINFSPFDTYPRIDSEIFRLSKRLNQCIVDESHGYLESVLLRYDYPEKLFVIPEIDIPEKLLKQLITKIKLIYKQKRPPFWFILIPKKQFYYTLFSWPADVYRLKSSWKVLYGTNPLEEINNPSQECLVDTYIKKFYLDIRGLRLGFVHSNPQRMKIFAWNYLEHLAGHLVIKNGISALTQEGIIKEVQRRMPEIDIRFVTELLRLQENKLTSKEMMRIDKKMLGLFEELKLLYNTVLEGKE